VVDGGVLWTPLALALGPAVAAAAVRQTVVVPMARTGTPHEDREPARI
jgi:hypothetical protein